MRCAWIGQSGPAQELFEVTARNEAELQQLLSLIQTRQTLFIDAEELQITKPIILETPGVTIRGRGAEETTIRCSDALLQEAFIIKSVTRQDVMS